MCKRSKKKAAPATASRREYVTLEGETNEGVALVAKVYQGLGYTVVTVKSWAELPPEEHVTRIALLGSGNHDIVQAAPRSCPQLAAAADRFACALLIGRPERNRRMEKIQVVRADQHLRRRALLAAQWEVRAASGR